MTRILFVCLGNICRSPMAEYLCRHLAAERGLTQIEIASAGTSGWHNGEDMHHGTRTVLQRLGIAADGFASSQVQAADLARYKHIIAMDDDNLAALARLFGGSHAQVYKITDLIPELGYDHVPDPWYSGDFDETRRILSAGCTALLERLSAAGGGT